MELLRLRKRLELARRGHKLLRDKLDQLAREFLKLAANAQTLREEIEEEWFQFLSFYLIARERMPLRDMEEVLLNPPDIFEIEKGEKLLLNLKLPFFHIADEKKRIDLITYGMSNTSRDLDSSLEILGNLIPKILELASIEKAILILGDEIKKTRRKVNALEYKMIPDLEETLSYISFRLSEIEREDFIRLVKVKERLKGE